MSTTLSPRFNIALLGGEEVTRLEKSYPITLSTIVVSEANAVSRKINVRIYGESVA